MSDLLGLLRDQRTPAPFSTAEAVRRRGRQRTRHHRALAVGAVLVVAAGSAGIGIRVADRSPAVVVSGSPSASPSAPPRPAVLSPGMLIEPADLGTGDWKPAKAELFEGPPWWWASLCPGSTQPALDHRREMQTVTYGIGGEPPVSSEILERYDEGWGTRSLVDITTVLATCSAAAGFRVVERAFAGDESLLVQDDSGKPATSRYVAVARVGDLVATVILPPGPDAVYAKELTRRAVSRLL